MDRIDLEEPPPALSSLRLSYEQRQILDYPCRCREREPGPHQSKARSLRVVRSLALCLAISAGSIRFADQIPPIIGAILVGFIIGILVMVARRQMNFERQWTFLELLIDWKFVDQLRKVPEPCDENAA